MESSTSRAEAERLLGISEKLLQGRDLNGSRDFAVLAQETEPLLDGSDQILAVVDVLLAGERRVNNHHDWYAVLQSEPRSADPDLLKRQYRRLALLLHPDKNHFPFADHAFRLVSQAWAVLSDPHKKPLYDNELSLFSAVDLPSAANNPKLPVRRTPASTPAPAQATGGRLQSFWTVCPYCYVMYEYPRVYEECCLKCERCKRGFHAAPVPEMPPMVQGQEAYYCCWAFFPLGFVTGKAVGAGAGEAAAVAPAAPGFPNWMPPMFEGAQGGGGKQGSAKRAAPAPLTVPVARKRGRPRLH